MLAVELDAEAIVRVSATSNDGSSRPDEALHTK